MKKSELQSIIREEIGKVLHENFTKAELPKYTKVANNIVTKLGDVTGKVVKKFNTPIGVVKVIASATNRPYTPGATKIKDMKGVKDAYIEDLINTDTVNVDMDRPSPSQKVGSDSNVDYFMYVFYYKK